MDETQIAEIWSVFKEYLDKKHIEMAAERYIDLLADYGTEDHQLTGVLGNDPVLDAAINYYLDLDDVDKIDEEYDWD